VAPNDSELLSKPDRPGERVFEREAQNPTEAEAVRGAGATGHPVFLPGEVWVGPRGRHSIALERWGRPNGRPEEGNDDGTTPIQKSDLFVVARKPVKAGGAKGERE
jgi:hypothetical protein